MKTQEIKLMYISTNEQLADALTKALVQKKFAEIMVKIVTKSDVDHASHGGVSA